MKRIALIPILVFFAFLVPSKEMTFAEGAVLWDSAGKPVCTASYTQQNIRMVPDGSGGAIIVWEDYRNPADCNIYAQKINSNGDPIWFPDGVAVCTATMSQTSPIIVGDGFGGAIIAWQDYRDGPSNIYAVRISSATGETYPLSLWTQNGKILSAPLPTIDQFLPEIVQVDVGGQVGAFVVWQETDYSQYSIYAQRIDGDGTIPWLAAPVLVSSGPFVQKSPKIINDGTGHVIITWQDCRSGKFDIYAQRIDINTPAVSWAPMGQVVSQAFGDQTGPEITADGSGGAIIVWTDSRDTTTGLDIYAQRISSDGVRLWTFGGGLEGIAVCKTAGQQDNANIVESHVGTSVDGAIIAWEDDALNGDIYAVKAGLYESNSDLTQGAKLIATGSQVQKYPRLVSDYQGGGIGAWIENDLLTSQYKIFATKRDHYGNPVWNIYPGVLVCQGSKIRNHQIVNDDAGGIIVAWEAIGASGSYDIFAQRVTEGASTRSASISGRVTLSDGETGIPGIEVWALQDEKVISSCITDTRGYYGIGNLLSGTTYFVRANWWANGIESSVTKETFAPSYSFNFTLEVNYKLGTIAGNVSGVEREAKRVSGFGLNNSLSPGNRIAFVELEQRGKVIVRVHLEMDGSYSIQNLLPGRFIARAYNGTIYSNSRIVDVSEGETLRVDFAFGIIPEETVYNYPNPAKNGSTTITYYCGYSDPEAEIKIYNIAGELVRNVEDNEIDGTDAPIYRFLWDCKNNSGKEIATGIYIYIVEVKEKGGSERQKVIKRMAVIR